MRFAKSICQICLICLIPCSNVRASESALAVAPAIIEAIIEPGGEPTQKDITIQNTTNFPLPIKGQVGAFISSEPIKYDLQKTFDASKWFRLDPSDFILQPKESKVIKVSIESPPSTEPGGHYATIFFQPLIPSGVITNSTTISLARVGVLTFLIAPGDIISQLELLDLTSPRFQLSLPLEFKLQFSNTGTVHLNPTGTVKIYNIFGKQIDAINLPPSIILPGTIKDIPLTWNGNNKIGKFTLKSDLYWGDNQQLKPVEHIFWILPLHIIIPSLILLTFMVKMFIVGKDRIKLAIQVLQGKHEKIS